MNHPQLYVFQNRTLKDLSFQDVFRFGLELSFTMQKVEVQALQIEVDSGLFGAQVSEGFPEVLVTQTTDSLTFSCPCTYHKSTLCVHQTHVLQTLLSKPDLQAFFNTELRYENIKKAAKLYGLEENEHPEKYLGIVFKDKRLHVVPVVEGLVLVNQSTAIFQKTQSFFEAKSEVLEEELRGLVFRKNKYTDSFSIVLIAGQSTQKGTFKNPLRVIDPLEEIWKGLSSSLTLFYSVLAKFQKPFGRHKADFLALKVLVDNPLMLPVFRCDAESLTAANLEEITLAYKPLELRVNVNLKAPFYEIYAEVFVNDLWLPLQELSIQYDYFLKIQQTLYLIPDQERLETILFFVNVHTKMLIHPTKFDEFKIQVLDKLGPNIGIDYTFLKPKVPKEEVYFWKPNYSIEKMLYLSDQQDFVSITPVLKYGDIEIPVFSKKQIVDRDPNGNLFTVERNDEMEVELTAFISRLHPEFEEQMGEMDYFYLQRQKFLDENWFLEAFEKIRTSNIKILGFNTLRKNRLSPYQVRVEVAVASGVDWFDTKLKVAFGKQQVSIQHLHKSLRDKSKFVELGDGTLGILPEEWIQKFNGYFKLGKLDGQVIRTPKTKFFEVLELYETEVLGPEIANEFRTLHTRLTKFESIEPVEVPAKLNARLRPYQQHGLNWLMCLDSYNLGGCLADDMGLGKTIQMIAFLLLQKQKHPKVPNLIVLPTSLIFNWLDELSKFAPDLKVCTHYAAEKVKVISEFNNFDVVITTYGTLLSDLHLLKAATFNCIVLDESQAIKNPDSQRYRAARLLKSRNKFVLTGTPIENNTFDLYGQLSFACPGLLGSKNYFKDIYALPIDQFHDQERAADLQKLVAPYILRRTKKQVATELPAKTEMLIYCEMSTEQRLVYDNLEKELREYVQNQKEQDLEKNSMHVLTGITKLRQVCNSVLLLPEENLSETPSAKIDTLIQQILDKKNNHKILVFSQFVGMLDLIKERLVQQGVSFEYLTGQTKNRAARVKNFQENPAVSVFLISLKAGGVGLNLTEADYVYLVDPWWNPAVENQAIDRVYRIGQKKQVIAVRLICPNTIEDKILKLQATKRELSGKLVKTDTQMFKSMKKEELLNLL